MWCVGGIILIMEGRSEQAYLLVLSDAFGFLPLGGMVSLLLEVGMAGVGF